MKFTFSSACGTFTGNLPNIDLKPRGNAVDINSISTFK